MKHPVLILSAIAGDETHNAERWARENRAAIAADGVFVRYNGPDPDGFAHALREGAGDATTVIVRSKWESHFGKERSALLDDIREWARANSVDAGWILMLDMDWTIDLEDAQTARTALAGLDPTSAYNALVRNEWGAIEFPRPLWTPIFSDHHYEGVLHEYLIGKTSGELTLGTVVYRPEGHRSREFGTDRERFLADAAVLEKEYAALPPTDWTRPRLSFYIAQSYRDAGDTASAVSWYETRWLDPGGWLQERYLAALNAFRLDNDPWVRNLEAAIELDPSRPEGWCELSGWYLRDGKANIGLTLARKAVDANARFVEDPSVGRGWLFREPGTCVLWPAANLIIAYGQLGDSAAARAELISLEQGEYAQHPWVTATRAGLDS